MAGLMELIEKPLADEPFVLLDVGASGGIAPMWNAFRPHLRAFGFEPLLSECARLNAASDPGIEFVPAFVAGSPMPTPEPFPMPQWWDNRFWYRTSAVAALQLQNKQMDEIFNRGDAIELSKDKFTIDTFVQARSLDPDFLKIDTDGTDFDVLRGAEKTLPRLLGVMIESEFHGSVRPDANTFSNIDTFMRAAGFSLVDLQTYRYSRAALPRRFIHNFPSGTEFGQIKWADAIYLRDAAFPEYCDLWNWRPSVAKLAKLAGLFELFGLADCAAELLVAFQPVFEKAIDVCAALDALTPNDLGGEALSYREYIAAFTANPSRFYSRLPEELQGHLKGLKEERDAARAALSSMQNSLSWRMAAPLRGLGRLKRKLGG
jgi:FkbM family methyltransferase